MYGPDASWVAPVLPRPIAAAAHDVADPVAADLVQVLVLAVQVDGVQTGPGDDVVPDQIVMGEY